MMAGLSPLMVLVGGLVGSVVEGQILRHGFWEGRGGELG